MDQVKTEVWTQVMEQAWDHVVDCVGIWVQEQVWRMDGQVGGRVGLVADQVAAAVNLSQ